MIDPPFACPPDDDLARQPVTVALAGAPQGKGRARSFSYRSKKTGKMAVGHYTPEKTATYEGMIRTAAMTAMGNRLPLDEPIEIYIRAIFVPPASWSKKKQAEAIVGDHKPGKKPDYDNIAKAWCDALNGVVFRDDCLIVKATVEKRYGPQALVAVLVRPA
jgi:Holliday junction resolvase RusA-like endonuclease